jgi:fimbrial chaperone protein
MWRQLTAAAALALSASLPAAGGAFAVAPIRVELQHGEKTAVLTVHNDSDAETLIQLRPVLWSQQNDQDQYQDSRDLLVTPPIFSLPAKGEQIIRVALRRAVDPARELSYRLFIQEVPPAASPSLNHQLTVALRLNLPIFISPPVKAAASLSWEAAWLPGGKLQLHATNSGNAHVQIIDFDLQFGAGTPAHGAGGSQYLLPGGRGTWTVSAPTFVDKTAEITVRGHSDQGEFIAHIAHVAS